MGKNLNWRNYNDNQKFHQEQREDRSTLSGCYEYVMPFGVYRNKPLASIPTRYLQHIRKYIKAISVQAHVADELDRRSRLVRD